MFYFFHSNVESPEGVETKTDLQIDLQVQLEQCGGIWGQCQRSRTWETERPVNEWHNHSPISSVTMLTQRSPSHPSIPSALTWHGHVTWTNRSKNSTAKHSSLPRKPPEEEGRLPITFHAYYTSSQFDGFRSCWASNELISSQCLCVYIYMRFYYIILCILSHM